MLRYYTRVCNFYYGSKSKLLVKEKATLPLNGNSEISFDKIEIISRKSIKKISIKNINSLPSHLKNTIKYDIKLKQKYKGKQLYKKVPSRRIKPSEENEEKELLNELKKLINTKSGKGKEAMEKQFEKLSKAQEKKDKANQKKKEEKEKHKNLMKLRKLMRGENVMNDYKFFKGLKIEDQKNL